MAPVRIGCSGWIYTSWRGRFYPEGCPQSRWLEYYSRVFDTVEVNSTFYRLPNRDAVARWLERTPDDFLFTIKSSRYLTHIRRLQDMGEGVRRLWERLEPVLESPKMGPVLWQLPENFHRDDDRLRHALEHLPPAQHHAFEFRHASWFHPTVLDLLREHQVALVIGDHPQRPFQSYELTADFTLIRFHYGRRGRRGNYSETELREWADRISAWRDTTVFAYFNNDWEGFAPANARRLASLLGLRRPARPAPERAAPGTTTHRLQPAG
jgi:uncharacterized protein YecE (DUF72 family)